MLFYEPRFPRFRDHAVLAFLLFFCACKKSAPLLPSGQAEPLPREVSKDSALLFTYVELHGMFATTDKAEVVPEVARQVVRIMSNAKDGPLRLNNANVGVIDLRELIARGKAQPQVMLREEFESRALAQLPPGDSCPLAGHHSLPLAEEAETVDPSDGPPVVILYGTTWCNACKSARQYLASNRIHFTVKNIEKDPVAAHELEQETSRFGIQADRVPILNVLGRLLVGYDKTRLDGYLADW